MSAPFDMIPLNAVRINIGAIVGVVTHASRQLLALRAKVPIAMAANKFHSGSGSGSGD